MTVPRFILRDATIHYENLPVVYPTIKRKCFAGLFDAFYFANRAIPYMPIRTCEKSSHSCFRNIVSFASMPGARQFRTVSRALRHMIAYTLHSYSIENMSTVCDELKAAFGDLINNDDTGRCMPCHCSMNGPTVATWDAGQAYEVLDPAQVLKDLDHVYTRCEAADSGLLQIWHSARSLVGFSKSLHRSLNDRVVLVTRSIKSCVKAYMNMRIFRFCDIFLKQISGVPIGGWLSSALLNLSASACESRFEARYTQLPATFGLDLPRHRIFAIKRYEDDVLGISHVLCPDCLGEIVIQIYKPHICMEPCTTHMNTSGGCTQNKFLDIMVYATNSDISFDVFHCNQEFCISGLATHHVSQHG